MFRIEKLGVIVHPVVGEDVAYGDELSSIAYLLELGVTFVYELPLRIKIGDKDGLLLPDFTILSERDYKTVLYLEHQGMMSVSKYRTKFNDTVYKYWLNNYLPERDVFFTFDSPNGGFDDTPVRSIVQMYIKREASLP